VFGGGGNGLMNDDPNGLFYTGGRMDAERVFAALFFLFGRLGLAF
jgi:hypothetical protein